ncbi:hypothetical protein GCM10029992_52630 [Glycomyces albus]
MIEFLFTVLGFAVNTAIVAYVATRLLDVRYTLWRLFVVSIIGQATGQYGLVQVLFEPPGDGPPSSEEVASILALLVFAVACAPVIAMILLVIWEAVIPTGTVPPVRSWFKGLRTRVRRSRRYLQILAVASRHGLIGLLRGRKQIGQDAEMARSLRRSLDDAGVTFVKLGQILSTRRDLLPRPTSPNSRSCRTRPRRSPGRRPPRSSKRRSERRWRRCSPSSTPSRWRRPRSLRSTVLCCAAVRRSWSRSAAPARPRPSSGTWTSSSAWPA